MPRPTKCRLVKFLPEVTYFKPRGVPMWDLEQVSLNLEGFEALRLVDVEGLNQAQAARRMNISRQTFGRILARARNAVATAVTGGLALSIEGGSYMVRGQASAWDKVKELKVSKIAISSQGPTLEDEVDPRFGRAGGFVIVDPETMDFEYIDNGSAAIMPQGAGIQAAETVAGTGADMVLTGYVGPKAFDALMTLGINVGQDLDGISVRQAVENFKAGLVQMAEGPNRARGGHGK